MPPSAIQSHRKYPTASQAMRTEGGVNEEAQAREKRGFQQRCEVTIDVSGHSSDSPRRLFWTGRRSGCREGGSCVNSAVTTRRRRWLALTEWRKKKEAALRISCSAMESRCQHVGWAGSRGGRTSVPEPEHRAGRATKAIKPRASFCSGTSSFRGCRVAVVGSGRTCPGVKEESQSTSPEGSSG